MQSGIITASQDQSLALLKKGVWLYFFLLIFEGGLRKWGLPALSTPLLLVRDPFAIWLIYKSFKDKFWEPNGYVIIVWGISILSFASTLWTGHGNLAVAIFGLRITLLHFPLIFIIGKIFTKKDVINLGRITIWLSLPMIVLLVLQFYSPQTAWVNRGVGGEGGAGFDGAMGYMRPPGTFSFTNGNAMFFQLVAVFVLFFWFLPGKSINKKLLLASTMALLISIPISFSRGLLFSIVISILFLICTTLKNPQYLSKVIAGGFGGVALLILLSNFEFVETAITAFSVRVEAASSYEGGLGGTFVDRFLGGMIGAIAESGDQPFFGYGLGMGTNAGSQMLTGKRTFLIAEGEWGRLIGEMGILFGILLILIRTVMVVDFLLRSWKAVGKGNILSWLLMSFGLLAILQGQWAQPTFLGFSTLVGGLVLAALNVDNEESSN